MGKIKALAKYKLAGRGAQIFFIFAFTFSALIFFGNFSFFVSSLFDMLGVSFISVASETVVRASICVLGTILLLIIFSPLRLGCERWFLLSAKGKNPSLKTLFYYFSSHYLVKSIKAVLFCVMKKAAALILFVFPSFCLFGVLYFSFGEGEISLYISYALFGFTVLLFLTGMLFYFVYSARYFAYYAIIVSNETIKPVTAFEKSMEITEGAYARICFFRLSFLPWLLLCVLVFPAFYVWGYYKESKIILCVKNEQLHS